MRDSLVDLFPGRSIPEALTRVLRCSGQQRDPESDKAGRGALGGLPEAPGCFSVLQRAQRGTALRRINSCSRLSRDERPHGLAPA